MSLNSNSANSAHPHSTAAAALTNGSSSSPPRSAFVLVIDGLHAGFLGPYGNTWVDTPGWNRLAAEATLWEFAVADSPQLQEIYDSYWTGTHAASRRRAYREGTLRRDLWLSGVGPAGSLPRQLIAAGHRAELLTDDLEIAQHSLASQFGELLMVEHDSRESTAEEILATRLGRFLSATLEHWESVEQAGLLWCHARGLADLWDAPLELRQQLADDEDPTPPDFVQPLQRMLPERFDPDERLGVTQAYGGQILALDVCLDAWLEEFRALADARNSLLIVTGSRSYPLGEHRRMGFGQRGLYSELLQVPLLVRYPGAENRLGRRSDLAQPADLHATLLDWFRVPLEAAEPAAEQAAKQFTESTTAAPSPTAMVGEGASGVASWGRSLCVVDDGRDLAVSVDDDQVAVRTPAWFLTESMTAGEPRAELYVKPDDRWESNEVARRCPEVVEQMRTFVAIVEAGRRTIPQD